MPPLVSILIPAYNAEQWVADTINSALNQIWPRKEIIIVDDGSRDQTLAIARQFSSKNVSVVTQENQGAAAARNKAIELCQGDYIQWLDADDLLCRENCESNRSRRTMWKQVHADLIRLGVLHVSRQKGAIYSDASLVRSLADRMAGTEMGGNHHMQTATWLVSRELTESAGPWDTRLLNNDDGEYFCRVIRASNGVRFVPDAKVYYRITDSSRLSYVGRSNKKLQAHLLGMRLQIDCLRSLEDSERVRAACLKQLQTFLIYFYPEKAALVRQVEQLAAALGGRLEIPQLCWKYSWIQKAFGWVAAKRARQHYNMWKSSIMRFWDKTLFLMERGNHANSAL